MTSFLKKGISSPLMIAIIAVLSVVLVGGVVSYKVRLSKTEGVAKKTLEPKKLVKPEKTFNEWVSLIGQKEPGLCEGFIPETYFENNPGVQQYLLEKGTLTLVLCNTYAYQNSFVAIYTDANDSHKILSFKEYISSSETYENKTPIELEYNQDSNTFTVFARGGGAADCGSSGKYSFDEDTQTAKLVEYRMKECGPEADIPSQEPWPLIFP